MKPRGDYCVAHLMYENQETSCEKLFHDDKNTPSELFSTN